MADNDSKAVQAIKGLIKKTIYKISYSNLPSNEDGSRIIKEYINSGKPFMACRMGANEARIVARWISKSDYPDKLKDRATLCAGIFPNDTESLYRFSDIYTKSIHNADILFTWGCYKEKYIYNKFKCQKSIFLRDSTNLFLFNNETWTTALNNKKVLVITPFVETSKAQYLKRELLFEKNILPTFKSIFFLQTVQSSAGNHMNCGFSSWYDALNSMFRQIDEQIDKQDFDIALIAGGAYGIPLAAYIKNKGKQSIHLASNLQILFGIRGKRFDNWPDWAEKMNEHWVYPSDKETPKGKMSVEGGSYWK